MSKKPETVFKERVLEDLKQLPVTWFFKTNEVAVHGIPDIVLCVNANFIVIELKIDDEEPTTLQKWTLSKVAMAGGIALVVNPKNWDKTLILLHEMACHTGKGKKKFSAHELN